MSSRVLAGRRVRNTSHTIQAERKPLSWTGRSKLVWMEREAQAFKSLFPSFIPTEWVRIAMTTHAPLE